MSSGFQQHSWLLGAAHSAFGHPTQGLLEPDLSFLFPLQVPEENINGVVNALQVSQAEKH